MKLSVVLGLVFTLASAPAFAETARFAVAANFTSVAETLAEAFAARSSHTVALSFGATGQLYTQITQGAPFDGFLSADMARPEKAIAEGHAVAGSAFVYALGQLALYGPNGATDEASLRGDFQKLAIADPKSAPYGKAALETLAALELADQLASKIVQGENISQTLQFVESGNAELGFVALSQVIGKDGVWLVPENLHEPIAQGAVLLTHGKDNAAAQEFLAFLRSPDAVSIIEGAGYAVP